MEEIRAVDGKASKILTQRTVFSADLVYNSQMNSWMRSLAVFNGHVVMSS